MKTNADGALSAHTLTSLNITQINLTENTTHIEMPDGSVITEKSQSFNVANVANKHGTKDFAQELKNLGRINRVWKVMCLTPRLGLEALGPQRFLAI